MPCLFGERVCVCTCPRSEEHTSELQSQSNIVCRLLLEKKKHAADKLSISSMIACLAALTTLRRFDLAAIGGQYTPSTTPMAALPILPLTNVYVSHDITS